VAAKILTRSGIHAVVLDGTDPTAVERAVRTGDHEGTDIVPTDAAGE
jgi:uridylate kinase